jgi:putative transposase
VLPGASWQCCRTHFMRNLLCRVPKSAQGLVATLVRTIFGQPDAACTLANHTRIGEQLRGPLSGRCRAAGRCWRRPLAFTAFPKSTGARSGPTTPRATDRELRRRTDVVGIFANREAAIRLVGAVLAEQHDE